MAAEIFPELLYEIFILVADAQDREAPRRLAVTVPWSLSKVCARWRAIVLRAPRMWSSIDIRLLPYKEPLSILQCALRRSGQHPLRIRMEEHAEAQTYDYLRILTSQCHRWEVLEMTLRSSHISLLNTTKGNVGLLKRFCIALQPTLMDVEDGLEQPITMCDGAERLEHVEITDGTFESAASPAPVVPVHITSVRLVHFVDNRVNPGLGMVSQYLRILRECVGLKTFHVGAEDWALDDADFGDQTIISTLTKFRANSGRFLASMTLPSLEDLCVGDDKLGDSESESESLDILGPIRTLLARSQSPIKRLSFYSIHLVPEILLQVLDMTPCLEFLHFSYEDASTWNSEFNDALRMLFGRMTVTTNPNFLPVLVEMTIRIACDEDEWEAEEEVEEGGGNINFLDQVFTQMVLSRAGTETMKGITVCTHVPSGVIGMSDEDVDALRALNETAEHSSGREDEDGERTVSTGVFRIHLDISGPDADEGDGDNVLICGNGRGMPVVVNGETATFNDWWTGA